MNDPHHANLTNNRGLPYKSPCRFCTINGNSLSLPKKFDNNEILVDLSVTLTLCEHLMEIPPEITELPSLTTLTIKSPTLRTLHPSIGKFKHLKHLYLHCPQLEALPSTISDLLLEYLDIPPLNSYPDTFGELYFLKKLIITPKFDLFPFMDYNDLQKRAYIIPWQISQLDDLQELVLTGTPIKDFEQGFECPPFLSKIFMSKCQLTSFPTGLLNFRGHEIHLGENAISTVPEEIMSMPHLRELYLHNNQLERFPNFLLRIPSLSALSLNGNPMEESGLYQQYMKIASQYDFLSQVKFQYRWKDWVIKRFFALLNQNTLPTGEDVRWENPKWIKAENFLPLAHQNIWENFDREAIWRFIKFWNLHVIIFEACASIKTEASFEFARLISEHFPDLGESGEGLKYLI